GLGVGEVDDAHGRVGAVPGVGEVDLSGAAAQEVAAFDGVCIVRAEVRDVGVDPQADAEAQLGEVSQHLFGVGEGLAVPVQVRPVPLGLPVAVQVQHVAGDAALADGAGAFQDALLGVVDEPGGDPGAQRPLGRQGGAAGEGGEPVQDLAGAGARDDVVVEHVVGDDQLHAAVRGLAHVELGRAAGVQQQAVAAAGHVQRHVLVGAVGLGAEGVEVPHAHPSSAQVEGGEAFAEPAEALVRGQREGLVVGGGALDGAATERQGAAASADVDVAAVLFGEQAAGVVEEAQVPGVEAEVGAQWAAGHDDVVVGDGDLGGGVGVGVDQGDGACGAGGGVGAGAEADAEDAGGGGGDAGGEGLARGGGGLEFDPPGGDLDAVGPGDGGGACVAGAGAGQRRGGGDGGHGGEQGGRA